MELSPEQDPPIADPPEEGEGDRLRQFIAAFRRAWTAYAGDAFALKEAVQHLVTVLKHDGVTPERVVLTLKREIALADSHRPCPSLGQVFHAHNHDHRLAGYRVVFDAFLRTFYRD